MSLIERYSREQKEKELMFICMRAKGNCYYRRRCSFWYHVTCFTAPFIRSRERWFAHRSMCIGKRWNGSNARWRILWTMGDVKDASLDALGDENATICNETVDCLDFFITHGAALCCIRIIHVVQQILPIVWSSQSEKRVPLTRYLFRSASYTGLDNPIIDNTRWISLFDCDSFSSI